MADVLAFFGLSGEDVAPLLAQVILTFVASVFTSHYFVEAIKTGHPRGERLWWVVLALPVVVGLGIGALSASFGMNRWLILVGLLGGVGQGVFYTRTLEVLDAAKEEIKEEIEGDD